MRARAALVASRRPCCAIASRRPHCGRRAPRWRNAGTVRRSSTLPEPRAGGAIRIARALNGLAWALDRARRGRGRALHADLRAGARPPGERGAGLPFAQLARLLAAHLDEPAEAAAAGRAHGAPWDHRPVLVDAGAHPRSGRRGHGRSSSSAVFGETVGTGKERIARAIHEAVGPGASGLWVPVRRASSPSDRAVRASSSGNARSVLGRGGRSAWMRERSGVAAAFFGRGDSDLSPKAQAKLLRFVQDREYRRSRRSAACNARTSASGDRGQRPPRRSVQQGRFRPDLMYRLCRETLTRCRRCVSEANTTRPGWRGTSCASPVRGHIPCAWKRRPSLDADRFRHPWPGNRVRELQSEMARASGPRVETAPCGRSTCRLRSNPSAGRRAAAAAPGAGALRARAHRPGSFDDNGSGTARRRRSSSACRGRALLAKINRAGDRAQRPRRFPPRARAVRPGRARRPREIEALCHETAASRRRRDGPPGPRAPVLAGGARGRTAPTTKRRLSRAATRRGRQHVPSPALNDLAVARNGLCSPSLAAWRARAALRCRGGSAGPAAVLRRPGVALPSSRTTPVGRERGRHRVERRRGADVVDAAAERQARVAQTTRLIGDQAGARPDARRRMMGADCRPTVRASEHAPASAVPQGSTVQEQAPAGPVGRRRVAQVVEVQECAAEVNASLSGQPHPAGSFHRDRGTLPAGPATVGQDRHAAEDNNEHGAPWLRARRASGRRKRRGVRYQSSERPERGPAMDALMARRGGGDRGDGAGQVGRQVDAECQDAVDRRPGCVQSQDRSRRAQRSPASGQ